MREGIAWSAGDVEREYTDTDRLVVAGIDGGGDLVAMPDGSWRLDPEGAFLRASSVGGGLEGGVAVEDARGTRYVFGAGCDGTPVSNARVVGSVGTYEWHLACVRDVHGHEIRYEYENIVNRPMLRRIAWNENAGETLAASVSFDWEPRPDPVVSFVSGQRSALEQRIYRIVVRRGPHVHRTIELSYLDERGLSQLGTIALTGWDGTRAPLVSLRYADVDEMMRPDDVRPIADGPSFGLRRETAELGDYDGDGLPDIVEMDSTRGPYRVFRAVATLSADDETLLGFGSPETVDESPSVWLGTPTGAATGTASRTQLADVDGDSRADILFDRGSKAAPDLRYIPLADVASPSASLGEDGNPLSPFRASVRMSDLDLDRRPDLIELDDATGSIRVSFGRERWTSLHTLLGASPDPSLTLENPTVRLADMNGDDLDDLVVLREGEVDGLRYYPGVGMGRFDPTLVRVAGLPTELSAAELESLQLRDMTGDGLPDLVDVGVDEVRIWPLEGPLRIREIPIVVSSLPPRRAETTAIRLVDINANGTTDILWVDGSAPGSGACSNGWCYVDLLQSGSPALLREVDNGIGLITTLDYAGMADMRARAASERLVEVDSMGIPTIADDAMVPMMVLASRRVRDQVEVDTVDDFVYAGGHYDGARREFLGFRRILTTRRQRQGDPADPLDDTAGWRAIEEYDVGASERALAGSLIRRDETDGEGVVYGRVENDVEALPLGEVAVDGTELARAFVREERRWRFEPNTDDPVALTRTVNTPDTLGFTLRSVAYGLVDAGDPSFGPDGLEDDETVTETSYVHCLGAATPECGARPLWRVGVIAATATTDENGVRTAAERRYYDDQSLGALGPAARLLPTRREVWVDTEGGDEHWVASERTQYDAHGNAHEILGANGQRTVLDYDATGTYLANARRDTGNPAFPELVWTATFDPAAGDRLTQVTAPDGVEERFAYDGLGRLTRHWMPGDDPNEVPSERFAYVQRAPVSYVDSERLLDDDGEAVARSRAFVSGAGNPLGTMSKVDAGRWVVGQRVRRNELGWVIGRYEPWYATTAPGELPPSPGPDVPWSRIEHDGKGREVRVTDARDAVTETVYGARSTTVYDALDVEGGRETATPVTTRRDGRNRIVEVIERRLGGQDPLRFPVAYDASDRAVRVPDAHGTFLDVTYDGRGLHTRVEHPSFVEVRRAYDDSGRLEREEDSDGRVRRYSYDLVDRETRREATRPDGVPEVPIVHHFDVTPTGGDVAAGGDDAGFAAGRLTASEGSAGARSFRYDVRGRVVAEAFRFTDGRAFERTTEWDRGDRMTSRTWPNGVTLDFEHDLLGRTTAIPGADVGRMEHDPRGLLTHSDLPQGVALDLGYDDAGLLTSIRGARGGSPFLDLERTLDGNTNPTRVRDALANGPFGAE